METSVKTCNKCQTEKPITEFHKNIKMKGGLQHYCKSCINEYLKKYFKGIDVKNRYRVRYNNRNKLYRKTHKEEQKKANKEWRTKEAKKHAFSGYKRRAAELNLPFDFDSKTFYEFVDQSCHYCGQTTETKRNGIDRKDNTKGYTLDNCLPCCKTCNYAKNAMGYEDFKLWVQKIYSHLFPAL